MHEIDVMQGDLPGFQFNIDGIGFIVAVRVELQRQRDVFGVAEVVRG